MKLQVLFEFTSRGLTTAENSKMFCMMTIFYNFFRTESMSNDNLWDEDLFPIFLCILVPLYIAKKKKMLHFFFLLLSIYLFPVDVSTGDNLPENKIGELCIRGPQIMKGYLDNEKATEETIKKGWLHTGDIAYHDADGNIFITDRLKELIKVKGFQVTIVLSLLDNAPN